MKKRILLLIAIALLSSCGDDGTDEIVVAPPNASDCPIGNFEILKTFDTLIFDNEYKGCTHIEGSVVVSLQSGNVDKMKQISSISGDLHISGTNDVVDLSGLDGLKSIGGDLIISSNKMKTITVLRGLESVGGNIIIERNHSLEELVLSPQLKNVSGNLMIEDNNSITGLNLFENLELMGGSILIQDNRELKEIKGFRGASGATVEGNIKIFGNRSLNSFNAFHNFKTINGEFLFESNDAILSFNGFSSTEQLNRFELHGYNILDLKGFNNLKTVKQDLQIFVSGLDMTTKFESLTTVGGLLQLNCKSMQDLDIFESLEGVGAFYLNAGESTESDLSTINSLVSCENGFGLEGSFKSISGFNKLSSIGSSVTFGLGTPNLEVINGFNNLNSVDGNFWVSYSENLERIEGFSNLISVTGEVKIERNKRLTELNILNKLVEAGSILINENDVLTEICGFSSLNQLEDFLIIRNNQNLKTLCGFDNIEAINHLSIDGNQLESISGFSSLKSISGSLGLVSATLMNLDGLGAITEIGGSLFLSLTSIEDLKDFSNLESIGGALEITHCRNLKTLEGFENLKSELEWVVVRDNPLLNNIHALNSISGIKDFFTIASNLSLNTCSIQLICDSLDTDIVTISSNGPGCKTTEEVLAECEL